MVSDSLAATFIWIDSRNDITVAVVVVWLRYESARTRRSEGSSGQGRDGQNRVTVVKVEVKWVKVTVGISQAFSDGV